MAHLPAQAAAGARLRPQLRRRAHGPWAMGEDAPPRCASADDARKITGAGTAAACPWGGLRAGLWSQAVACATGRRPAVNQGRPSRSPALRGADAGGPVGGASCQPAAQRRLRHGVRAAEGGGPLRAPAGVRTPFAPHASTAGRPAEKPSRISGSARPPVLCSGRRRRWPAQPPAGVGSAPPPAARLPTHKAACTCRRMRYHAERAGARPRASGGGPGLSLTAAPAPP
jgi:hypothetical protein